MVPVVLLILIGLAMARPAQLTPFAPHGYAALGPAMFLALFPYQGFEVIALPAGETREAQRAAPTAVVLAFLVSMALYTAVQAVVVGVAKGKSAGAAVRRAIRRWTTTAATITIVDVTSINVPIALVAGVGAVRAAP